MWLQHMAEQNELDDDVLESEWLRIAHEDFGLDDSETSDFMECLAQWI